MNSAATRATARKQLRLFYDALCSWDVCQRDFIEDIEVLLRMLLQLSNSHQPTVWHPSILPLFPDLPAKFQSATLRTSEQRLGMIKSTADKMSKWVGLMFDAAHWLTEHAAAFSVEKESLAETRSPFVCGSVERYAEAAVGASNLCRDIVGMRSGQIGKVQDMLDSLKGESDVVLPPNTFENNTQVVNIMLWRELPGTLDRSLLGPENSNDGNNGTSGVSTLTLAELKDLLLNNEHVDKEYI
ncbi:hypothetical protein H4217_008895 [Coemansia sp. RSA 1939]|nr:hypothetical protein H4217_008895 [Coemansia sp. RSA 1939]KAJ2609113.1 hypothetical protein EV177_004624 [Coemansia sp. RSA 1804]